MQWRAGRFASFRGSFEQFEDYRPLWLDLVWLILRPCQNDGVYTDSRSVYTVYSKTISNSQLHLTYCNNCEQSHVSQRAGDSTLNLTGGWYVLPVIIKCICRPGEHENYKSISNIVRDCISLSSRHLVRYRTCTTSDVTHVRQASVCYWTLLHTECNKLIDNSSWEVIDNTCQTNIIIISKNKPHACLLTPNWRHYLHNEYDIVTFPVRYIYLLHYSPITWWPRGSVLMLLLAGTLNKRNYSSAYWYWQE